MRVLIGCEFSGRVREAFRARGHDAWSCDLQPAEDGSPYHVQDDVLRVLDRRWNLFIVHPDCTYLTVSGNRWFKDNPEREEKQRQARAFVGELYDRAVHRLKIPMALENPVGRLSTLWRRPDQIIQPWMFGEPKMKATCLWLAGLRHLTPTHVAGPPPKNMTLEERKAWGECHHEPPGPNRKNNRSRTYLGIADAMAAQWGDPSGWYGYSVKQQERLFA